MQEETLTPEFTPEWESEQDEVMEKLLDAFERDDEVAIDEWSRRLEPPADALLAAKRMGGPGFRSRARLHYAPGGEGIREGLA